jgi:hypothetical protein
LGQSGNPLTPGQTAIIYTSQIGNLTNPNVPGTHPDGFWQEPVDIVPIASPSTHIAYQNGTVFVVDQSNSNDNVVVTPTGGGGADVSSNLGSHAYSSVNGVVVGLGDGNNNVAIGNLPGAAVDVTALSGNNNIVIGDTGKLLVHVGGGNNNIITGNTSPGAQFIAVGGNGNNNIITLNSSPADIVVAGNGNNNIVASGTAPSVNTDSGQNTVDSAGDFIEVLGNGNNNILDFGTSDVVWLGGSGNNNILNDGTGSWTNVLAAGGHDHIFGPTTPPGGEGAA